MKLHITQKADFVRQQRQKMEADQQSSPSLCRYSTQSVDLPLDSRLSEAYRLQMLEEVMKITLRESFSADKATQILDEAACIVDKKPHAFTHTLLIEKICKEWIKEVTTLEHQNNETLKAALL